MGKSVGRNCWMENLQNQIQFCYMPFQLFSHKMATNYILENCNNFFTDRKVVMKFEGKDFPFRPKDILKNRNEYKLMYQNVIC